MSQTADRGLAAWVGLCAAGMVFAASLLHPLPLPWYLPVERRWEWGLTPSTLGMDFYGRLIWAAGAGSLAAAAAGLLGRALPDSRRERAARTAGAWALISLWVGAWVLILSLATRQLGPGAP